MDLLLWALVLVVVVVVAVFVRRVQMAKKLRKQLKECTTYQGAVVVADRASAQGFPDIDAEAWAKKQQLFTEFLRVREEQFQKELDNAVGSEEKLFALLRDGRYSEQIDPHFNSRVGKMIREQLRPFTEKRILEATSFEGLLSLQGGRRYLKQLFMGGGFNRIDEALEDLFFQKAKQLACKEALASKSSCDLCFEVKTGDKFIDALIAIKKETVVLTSQDTPVYVGRLSTDVDAVLETALERM